MIKSVSIMNGAGEVLVMELKSPEKSGFSVKNCLGLNPTKAYINISESLYQDGGYFNSARGSSRNIVLTLGIHEIPGKSIEDLRQQTYLLFPVKEEVLFFVETDNTFVYITGYVESNEPVIFSREEETVISIVCPSPVFSSVNWTNVIFSGTIGGFTFPFANNSLSSSLLKFGDVISNTIINVPYPGTESCGIQLEVDFLGRSTGLTFYNNSLGQLMSLNTAIIEDIIGTQISAGDKLVISTTKNNKTITYIKGVNKYNVLSALTTDSTWLQLGKGDNLMIYTAASGVAYMQVSLKYQTIYGGI